MSILKFFKNIFFERNHVNMYAPLLYNIRIIPIKNRDYRLSGYNFTPEPFTIIGRTIPILVKKTDVVVKKKSGSRADGGSVPREFAITASRAHDNRSRRRTRGICPRRGHAWFSLTFGRRALQYFIVVRTFRRQQTITIILLFR